MGKKAKLLALIALIVTVAVTSCNRGSGAGSASRTDLGGMHIVIGNWWANYNVNDVVPANDEQEKLLDWRTKIQRENNFTMEERQIGGWGEMAQLSATSIMAGAPAATIFVLQPDWAMSLVRNGLAYPITDNTAVDLRNPRPAPGATRAPEWNQNTLNSFTINGKGYAVSTGINMSNAQVVFFNKRLFREAGLDPELPYNLQRDGTWTWDRFLEICRQLTRDINNDGIIDTYAMPRDHSAEILSAIMSSNGATYIDRDSTGRFVNATGRPEFIEALQYTLRLNEEGVMKARPDNTNWDWFKSEFEDGNVAMRIDESYVWGELQNMRDDWGVVMFPKGPRSSTYRMYTRENVLVVPATFTAEQVNNIMTALALWYTPISDDWKAGWYNTFRDARAVDETLALMRNPDIQMTKNFVFIPGLERGDIAWNMWWFDGSPSQLVESVSSNWNALVQEVNVDLFR